MVTKKDFEIIAEIIRSETQLDNPPTDCLDGLYAMRRAGEDIAERLANYFVVQNPRFNKKRFMRACGL